MTSPRKRYMRDLTIVLAIYAAALIGTNMIDMTSWPAPARLLFALTPVIAAIFIVPVVLKFVAVLDEVQRRGIAESCLVSMLVVGLGTFAYSFAENALELPQIGLVWVWPALMGGAGVALIFVRKRFG